MNWAREGRLDRRGSEGWTGVGGKTGLGEKGGWTGRGREGLTRVGGKTGLGLEERLD